LILLSIIINRKNLKIFLILSDLTFIFSFYLKNMTARGFKVCAWTVNERNEMVVKLIFALIKNKI